MAIIRYNKNEGIEIGEHFNSIEFSCPCFDCKETLIDSTLIDYLEKMRKNLKTKLTVTSGYRCENYQTILRLRGYETAKGVSQHTLGKAADVTNGVSLGAELEEAAREAGFKSVGVGRNWVHVDLRSDLERRWFYAKK